MSPSNPPDPEGKAVLRTSFGHFFIPSIRPETPEGIDLFIPAVARDHQFEMQGIAAFVAVWSFAAVGCLLPWGEMSLNHALQNSMCLLIWIPFWFVSLVLCFAIPGALILPLLHRGLLTQKRARRLSAALACLIFSVIALYLARSPLTLFQGLGWIWMGALSIEAFLSFVRLFTKIRS